MSKNKERKIAFNGIDVLVIVGILVALVVGVRILNMKPLVQEVETRIATAVVELKEVDKALLDRIKVGDDIFLTVDNVDRAKVVAVTEPAPNELLGLDEQKGEYKYTSSPNSKYTGYVTVEAEVKEDDANIYAGSTSLKVGKAVFIKGKGYSSKGYVVELDTKAKGE